MMKQASCVLLGSLSCNAYQISVFEGFWPSFTLTVVNIEISVFEFEFLIIQQCKRNPYKLLPPYCLSLKTYYKSYKTKNFRRCLMAFIYARFQYSRQPLLKISSEDVRFNAAGSIFQFTTPLTNNELANPIVLFAGIIKFCRRRPCGRVLADSAFL